MHARVTVVQGPPGGLEKGQALFERTMVPALRELPGFAGVVLLVDRESGRGSSISTWDSEEAMRGADATIEAVRAGNRAEMAELGIEVVETEFYELTMLARDQPPVAGACVRAISGQGRADSTDAQRDLIRERALPVFRAQKGFRAAISGVNRENARFFASSAWDTAADREASEAALLPLREEMQQLVEGELQVTRAEVLFAEIKAGAEV